MSVDYNPTCPDCGDDLIYAPNVVRMTALGPQYKLISPHEKDWFCPNCINRFDIPEGPLPEPEPE